MMLLCIFAQPEPLRSVLFVWFHELEVCINATAALRFGLEPAELSNEKIINCFKNSLKGQIPLQLAELSGKHSLSI